MSDSLMTQKPGLPASSAVLLPLFHPPAWPSCIPLPQDGAQHTGTGTHRYRYTHVLVHAGTGTYNYLVHAGTHRYTQEQLQEYTGRGTHMIIIITGTYEQVQTGIYRYRYILFLYIPLPLNIQEPTSRNLRATVRARALPNSRSIYLPIYLYEPAHLQGSPQDAPLP